MTLLEWLESNEGIDKQGAKIKDQWVGLDESGNKIKIDEVTRSSGKKVFWQCEAGHRWLAKPVHRTNCLSGCPECSKLNQSERTRKARTKQGVNDLLTWCKNNDERGTRLLKQFTGLDEHGIKHEIDQVTYGSTLRLKWICEKGHEWYAGILSRTSAEEHNCPYCAGNKIIVGETDLYTWCKENNKEFLIEQFVGEDASGNKITMQELSHGSNVKVKWVHYKNGEKHEWVGSVKHRTLRNSGCPYCNGSKQVLTGFNDLDSWCERNPDFGEIIREEYTGIDIYGNITDIDKIATFSSSKLLWRHWTSDGDMHEWYATLHNRITHLSLCPMCNKGGTSLPEQIIYRCFKQLYPNTINRGKRCGYEFDIMLPDLNTYIEYGSTYYHEGREQRDKEKEELCNKLGVNFIQIVGDCTDINMEETWSNNLIIAYISFNRIASFKKIVKHIFKTLKLDFNKIDYNKAVQDSIEFMES